MRTLADVLLVAVLGTALIVPWLFFFFFLFGDWILFSGANLQ